MKELMVVAIGGNSIIKDNASQSVEHQAQAVKAVAESVLEMLASLNAVDKRKDRLIEITADGRIDGDEIGDFITIQRELERISITVETL